MNNCTIQDAENQAHPSDLRKQFKESLSTKTNEMDFYGSGPTATQTSIQQININVPSSGNQSKFVNQLSKA